MQIFADRLRQARTERGISQRELARRIGVNPRLVSSYEMNQITPRLDSAVALAQELDCPLDFLCGLES